MSGITGGLAVLGLVGGAISAFGTAKAGQEEKEMQDYNARLADNEALIVEQKGILNEVRARKALKTATGRQIAGFAKAGVKTSTGSPLEVIADSIANAELEMAIDRFNIDTEASRKRSEADVRRTQGRQVAEHAKIQAGAGLLQTISKTGIQLSKEKIGS